jgi:hypothetical protein
MIIQDSAEKIGEHGYAHWSGKPVTPDAHSILFVPQTIADGWEAYCSCGQWRAFESLYAIEGRDELRGALKKAHEQHLLSASTYSDGKQED